MSPRGPDVCVVIPMYNEVTVIDEVLRAVLQHVSHVVCVDDGSADTSAEVAAALGVKVVRHPDNLGQGAAIQTGLDFALLDPDVAFIVTFDADGQHDIGDALQMVERAENGEADVILGSRFISGTPSGIPRPRRAVLRAAVWFTRRVSSLQVTDTHNGLRVFTRGAAESISLSMPGMAHASEVLDQIGRRGLTYVEHPTQVAYSEYSRAKGQSNVNAFNVFLDVIGYVLRGRT